MSAKAERRRWRHGWTRREFLKGALAAAGGGVAAPYIITSGALGAGARPAASERIVMGAIGIGGRGRYVMGAHLWHEDVQMVAVCDAQGDRRAAAKAAVDAKYGNADCKAYIDLREMLARDDIDAIVIATGDNWHSMASILAVRAGKDVYCEKPISVTIAEGRALADTVRRHAAVLQCGTQRRNVGHFVFAVDLARSGKLGRLTALHAERARNWPYPYDDTLPPEPQPARDVVDWDLWLGPAVWKPYNRTYHTRSFWGGHRDFAGGSVTEWGSHTVDLCQWANDADDTSPVEYEPAGDDGRDVVARYANGVKLHIRRGLRFGSCPVRFEGEEGYVEVGDSGQMEVHPASLLQERRFAGGYRADDHVREFLNCVKSRNRPSSHAEAVHRSISACHAANISLRLGRKVRWDPAKEQFIDDDQANRLCARAMREPWCL